MIMNEKQFIQDLWDMLNGYSQYITQEQFAKKYSELCVYADGEEGTIHLADDHNEWHINLQKVWTDETNLKD